MNTKPDRIQISRGKVNGVIYTAYYEEYNIGKPGHGAIIRYSKPLVKYLKSLTESERDAFEDNFDNIFHFDYSSYRKS